MAKYFETIYGDIININTILDLHLWITVEILRNILSQFHYTTLVVFTLRKILSEFFNSPDLFVEILRLVRAISLLQFKFNCFST